MFRILRHATRLAEIALALPMRLARIAVGGVAFNPRLGPFRYLIAAALAYAAFALTLVYIVAPVRGLIGAQYLSEKLRYDAERWLATAIYDAKGSFVGTFDPRLDSRRDVNYTDAAIDIGDYTANPDHKSIPVREVPEHYWRCLLYHEDRYLGGVLNPYGIDLLGVLKIPYSTVRKSLASRRPTLGVGGSTLPMQLARVIYKTPPRTDEGALGKLGRKLKEWWLAPVIYHELTRVGDLTPLKQWAANHLWLAQRTGGQPLHGVEVTSRIVFGKEARDLTIAEQYVLASAVNKPIILLEGSERLNEVRIDRWRYIAEVRARTCAERLIVDPEEQRRVVFDLVGLAGGPPDPRVKPRLQDALDTYAPALARRGQANPVIRANALLPTARFGLREQMKQEFGFGWRQHVRGLTTTFDVVENLALGAQLTTTLRRLHATHKDRLWANYTLDPGAAGQNLRTPDIIVAAADHTGTIVRYFQSGETAPYFGSASGMDPTAGFYDPARESRMIASVGKMLAAVAIANEGRDNAHSLYLDAQAPERGLETCNRGGNTHAERKAIVAFACSLNSPLLSRTARMGPAHLDRLVAGFGFAAPPASASGEETPLSTAVVLGHIAGAPRRVHHVSGVILAALIGQGAKPVPAPSLIRAYDYTSREHSLAARHKTFAPIIPHRLIRPEGADLLKLLLQAPLCYTANGNPHGTLKSLQSWCAERRPDLRLHFAKTGTSTTTDPSVTVDTWITGGLQFTNGAAYSYVVVVGTGSPSAPWATGLHASQIAAPLLETLLTDLAGHARRNPQAALLPSRPQARPVAAAAPSLASRTGRLQTDMGEREQIFHRN